MAKPNTSLERIELLKAEIESLRQAAVSELTEKRKALAEELASIDSQLADITGKPQEGVKRARRSSGGGRSIPLQELKDLLAKSPDKTINIRKEGLELRNIKVLATANPTLLRLGGKGPWPTVTLLK
jgi:hypothetical protein